MVAALTVTLAPTTGWCTGGGCVLLVVVLVPLVVPAAVLLSWAVMGVARVRRAWQVALVSPVVVLFGWGVLLPLLVPGL